MKPSPWILPVVAAIAVGGWIFSRKTAASTLEHEITMLRERIRQARSSGDGDKRHDADEKTLKGKERRVNWKDVASSFSANVHEGPQDIRTMMRLQRLLMDLSAEELCGQLDEISATDMDDRVRRQLEGMIFGALVEKDPKLALDRFESRIADEGFNWQLTSALQKWAAKDVNGATAWMDKQLAAGVFESKSLDGGNASYLRFESALVGALLKSDVQAAISRVKALPEGQRDEFFRQGLFLQVGREQEGAYVKLIREAASSSAVGGFLADHAGFLARRDGFDRVDEFISTSHATGDEKARIVSEVAEHKWPVDGKDELNVAALDDVRAWAAKQAPGAVDQVTGDALARALRSGHNDFEKVSELVLKYNDSAGNDGTLVSFLTNNWVKQRGGDDKQRVLQLVGRIKDPVKRQEVVDLIGGKEGAP